MLCCFVACRVVLVVVVVVVVVVAVVVLCLLTSSKHNVRRAALLAVWLGSGQRLERRLEFECATRPLIRLANIIIIIYLFKIPSGNGHCFWPSPRQPCYDKSLN